MAKLIFTEVIDDVSAQAAAGPFAPPVIRDQAIECLEVRFWGKGGKAGQFFEIGSGTNFNAEFNVWMEVAYTVHGAQIFYTRTFLHLFDGFNVERSLERLKEIQEKGEGGVGFSGMLPESSVSLRFEKHSYTNYDGAQQEYTDCIVEVSADAGVVFGDSAPNRRTVTFKADLDDYEAGVSFMEALIHELDDALHGKHPNPADQPLGGSEWPFVRQLNLKAYNAISEDYQESYFENPLLYEAFDNFLAQLPAGGHVLDAGCGHGDPVITRLLEKGFQVSGTDFSPAMLKKARERFPQVTFYDKTTSEIDFEGEFDAACSFSSVLYLDPIDLYPSIYRLYRSLKPGGLLFLYGYDLHPGWRGTPLDLQIKQWMWSWTYGMDEAEQAVKEHGFFEVLNAANVTTQEEREARLARAKERMEEQRKKFAEEMASFRAAQEAAQAAETEEAAEENDAEEVSVETDSFSAEALQEPEMAAVSAEAAADGGVHIPQAGSITLPAFEYPPLEQRLAYQYVIVARRV